MISSLSQTATFSDIFLKINEIISAINLLETQQGILGDLNTLDKSSLVKAINEKSPSFNTSLILEE